MESNTELVLYGSTWTIFPNRVTAYLRAKGITDQVKFVDCSFENNLVADLKLPGPIPILRITDSTTNTHRYIRESVAIIEYLEDILPNEPNLRGNDPFETAQIRSLICAVEPAVQAFLLYVYNSSVMMAKMERPQSRDAAIFQLATGRRMLSHLVRTASTDGPLLCDHQRLTIADIVVAASFAYLHLFYGADMWEGFPRLEQFWDRVKGEAWLDLKAWEGRLPPFKELARQETVRWDDVGEEWKEFAKDGYAEQ